MLTDLDGSLLDAEDYSSAGAREALEELKRLEIPVVICTSKTRAEVKHFQKELGMSDPFISENGAAIFIPRGYFGFDFEFERQESGYKIIEFGEAHQRIVEKMEGLRQVSGLESITTFSDLTVGGLAIDSGLPLNLARLAKMREYTEPFRFSGNEKLLKREARKRGIWLSRGGRYWSAGCGGEKGKASKALIKLFSKNMGYTKTIGIGDSLNDLPMLKAVDIPILIRKKDGGYEKGIKLANMRKSASAGPTGWCHEVLMALQVGAIAKSKATN